MKSSLWHNKNRNYYFYKQKKITKFMNFNQWQFSSYFKVKLSLNCLSNNNTDSFFYFPNHSKNAFIVITAINSDNDSMSEYYHSFSFPFFIPLRTIMWKCGYKNGKRKKKILSNPNEYNKLTIHPASLFSIHTHLIFMYFSRTVRP